MNSEDPALPNPDPATGGFLFAERSPKTQDWPIKERTRSSDLGAKRDR
jgi:hypothetical protein